MVALVHLVQHVRAHQEQARQEQQAAQDMHGFRCRERE
jgi:hypothetical protein